MEYRHIADIDKPISQLVQGTMMINFKTLETSFDLLDAVVELGCTTFDTAHGYGNGDSERVLGQWLQERGLREKIVILDKGAHHNQDRKRVTPFDITAHIYDSLARLKTDYIDLYLLHRDNPAVPVGPIVEVLNEHKQAGRINAFGGSNWTHERIQEANAYAESHGLTSFIASSPNYSLAGGFFSDRFRRDNLDTFESYLDKLCVESYCYEDNFERLDRTRLLAEEKGLTVPQIALAFILNQPLNIFALVGCRTKAEFKANAEAADLKLTPEELAWLDLKSDSR